MQLYVQAMPTRLTEPEHQSPEYPNAFIGLGWALRHADHMHIRPPCHTLASTAVRHCRWHIDWGEVRSLDHPGIQG